jgi:hypothetical protein
MGCSSCAAAAAARAASAQNKVSNVSSSSVTTEECLYTDYMLNVWLVKLKWFKDTGTYVRYNVAPSLLNKYLGVVLTSLNVNNKCVYKLVLDDISKLITVINGIEQ